MNIDLDRNIKVRFPVMRHAPTEVCLLGDFSGCTRRINKTDIYNAARHKQINTYLAIYMLDIGGRFRSLEEGQEVCHDRL